MHFLVWLKKHKSPIKINSILSVELLYKKHDPLTYNIISNFMIQGSCGDKNP